MNQTDIKTREIKKNLKRKNRKNKKTPEVAMVHPNPAKTASNVCPAIMFANNLTERLTTRITYEINSIVINNGHNANGTPDGKKKLKKCRPWF